MPMSGSDATISFTVEGHPVAKSDHPSESIGLAQPGYFETMRIPLIAGRTFTNTDKTDKYSGGDHRPGIREEVFRRCKSDWPAHDCGSGR